MKVYLSTKKNNSGYTTVSNLMTLDSVVMDSEAESIIVDGFLSCFTIYELDKLLDKIISKMRLNSEITIVETDFDVISLKANRDELDLETVNSILFDSGGINSVLTCDLIVNKLQNKLIIVEQSVDHINGTFIIKARRAL